MPPTAFHDWLFRLSCITFSGSFAFYMIGHACHRFVHKDLADFHKTYYAYLPALFIHFFFCAFLWNCYLPPSGHVWPQHLINASFNGATIVIGSMTLMSKIKHRTLMNRQAANVGQGWIHATVVTSGRWVSYAYDDNPRVYKEGL